MSRALSVFRRLIRLRKMSTPPPSVSEATTTTTIDNSEFNPVTEGSATILFPKAEDVFYNPIQQFNRDLSTLSIRAWSEIYGEQLIKKRKHDQDEPDNQRPYISILEALSATGLRAVRYAKEIPRVQRVVANDFLAEAVKSIERNAKYNGVENIVVPNKGDANAYMHQSKADGKLFNVIDLDPYGTASPFIDAAIQSVSNDGLLLVTCTDLAVLAGGGYPEKCFALYGGSPLINHDAAHEAALRLVLGMISNSAAKYKKTIEPLMCLSIDFYVRLFIRVKTSPAEVKELGSKMSTQYMCSGCGAIQDQPLGKVTVRENGTKKFGLAQAPQNLGPLCSYCGFVNHVAGPMYNGKLHNKDFISKVLELNKDASDEIYKTRKRIEGMLTLAQNELDDAQFYFKPERVSSIIKCQVPPLKVLIAGLGNLGYDASLTHAIPSAIKTNAPWGEIWGLLKEYVKQRCPEHKMDKLSETTAGYRILTNENVKCEKEVSFELNEMSAKVEKLRKLKITRYQENPQKNWGPKAKPQ